MKDNFKTTTKLFVGSYLLIIGVIECYLGQELKKELFMSQLYQSLSLDLSLLK